MKPCAREVGHFFAGLVCLLGELHVSGHSVNCTRIVTCNVLSARRAHRVRDISEDINAHIIGFDGTRLPFYRAWDDSTRKSDIHSMAGTLT